MKDLLNMIKLLNVMEDLGLYDYQIESLHNIIEDMIELNNRQNKKVENVKK